MTRFKLAHIGLLFGLQAAFVPGSSIAHPPNQAGSQGYAPSSPGIQIRQQAEDRYCWTVSASVSPTCGPCAVAFGADGTPAHYTCVPEASRLVAGPSLRAVRGTVTVMLGTTRYIRDRTGAVVMVPQEIPRHVPATVYVPEPSVSYQYRGYTVGDLPYAGFGGYTNASTIEFCQTYEDPRFFMKKHDAQFRYAGLPLTCYEADNDPRVIEASFTTTTPHEW